MKIYKWNIILHYQLIYRILCRIDVLTGALLLLSVAADVITGAVLLLTNSAISLCKNLRSDILMTPQPFKSALSTEPSNEPSTSSSFKLARSTVSYLHSRPSSRLNIHSEIWRLSHCSKLSRSIFCSFAGSSSW